MFPLLQAATNDSGITEGELRLVLIVLVIVLVVVAIAYYAVRIRP